MKKAVLVGCGSRGYAMFGKPISNEFKEHIQLCGVYDINPLRAKLFSKKCGDIPVFDDFENMMLITKPDYVIVTTVDAKHHEYIIKALEHRCDVISEKPMTIDIEKCDAVMYAEKQWDRRVLVTFNCRFMPIFSKIKELMLQNAIGDIYSVHLEWMLDQKHGASYFRRWHRQLKNSGGLLVHKATHHFDVVNWCIDGTPKTVSAFGSRLFYGPTRENRGERCLTCLHKDSCEFYIDIQSDSAAKEMYLDTEAGDGYIWDRCVFGDEIDIYDTMSVNVEYEGGATLAYSLKAYSPYEGWKLTITGSQGRLEAEEFYSGPRASEPFETIRIYHPSGDITSYGVKKGSGAHGGGDSRLRQMLFISGQEDPLGRMAGSIDGAKSLLIGACANLSIAKKRTVDVKEILGKYK